MPHTISGNFIHKNNKPALSKDCQAKEFRNETELRAYWKRYQLLVGYVWWECHNGTPKVTPESTQGQYSMEITNPACADARGRKHPCV